MGLQFIVVRIIRILPVRDVGHVQLKIIQNIKRICKNEYYYEYVRACT